MLLLLLLMLLLLSGLRRARVVAIVTVTAAVRGERQPVERPGLQMREVAQRGRGAAAGRRRARRGLGYRAELADAAGAPLEADRRAVLLPRQRAAAPVGRARLFRQLRGQRARVVRLAFGVLPALRRGPVRRGRVPLEERVALHVVEGDAARERRRGEEVARSRVRPAELPARALLAIERARARAQGPPALRQLALGRQLQRFRYLLGLVAVEHVEALAAAAARAPLEAEAALDDAVAAQVADLPDADEAGRHADRHAEALLLDVQLRRAGAQLRLRRRARYYN